jgi:hypothetical protein
MHTNVLSLTILTISSECFPNALNDDKMHSQDNVDLFTHFFQLDNVYKSKVQSSICMMDDGFV